jgi:hypothetical protein
MTMRPSSLLLIAIATSAAVAVACSNDSALFSNTGAGGSGGVGGGATTNTTTGTAGGGATTTTTSSVGPGGAGGEGGSCMPSNVALSPGYGPVDAIFVVDNSFQMGPKLDQLETHLHPSFVHTLDMLGLDIQVIMVSDHGATQNEVCIGPPLSQTTNCSGPPQGVAGRFRHYSVPIQFGDALCKTLDTVVGTLADEFNQAPQGWQSWLRSGARKAIVPFALFGVNCSWNNTQFQDLDQSQQGQVVATNWDSALLNLVPQHFGTLNTRKYGVHSFVSITPKPGDLPFLHTEPLQVTTCSSQLGTGYQWLSIGTESSRFSICNEQSYATTLAELAFQVAEQVIDPCNYTLPTPPADLGKVDVILTLPNDAPQTLIAVDGPQSCAFNSYYWEGSDKLRFCPQLCGTLSAYPDSTVEAELSCR